MKTSILITLCVLVPSIFMGKDLSRENKGSTIYPTLEAMMTQTGLYSDIVKITPATIFTGEPYATIYKTEKVKGAKKFNRFEKTLAQVWGIKYNDTLYVNTVHVTKLPGFAKAHSTGRYILIYVPIPDDETVQKELRITENTTSAYNDLRIKKDPARTEEVTSKATKGPIGRSNSTTVSQTPIVAIVIDTENNTTRCFTSEYADELHQEYPDLTNMRTYLDKGYSPKIANLLNLYIKALNVTSDYYKALE